MYGKLLIPQSHQEVVMVPQSAVIFSGQLELVRVKLKDTWQLRYVKNRKPER